MASTQSVMPLTQKPTQGINGTAAGFRHRLLLHLAIKESPSNGREIMSCKPLSCETNEIGSCIVSINPQVKSHLVLAGARLPEHTSRAISMQYGHRILLETVSTHALQSDLHVSAGSGVPLQASSSPNRGVRHDISGQLQPRHPTCQPCH